MTKDDVLSPKQYIEVTNLMDKPLINTARKETQTILKKLGRFTIIPSIKIRRCL